MRHAPSALHFSHAFRPAPAGGIEWEELPSLAARVRPNDSSASAGIPWDATRPAALETQSAPMPFREPMRGMAIREMTEPDIFRHFFGR